MVALPAKALSRHAPRVLLLASLAVLVVLLSMTLQADYDFWWHARLGGDVLDQLSLTLPDSASYTFAGQPQANGEWLSDVLIYLAFSNGGYVGANLLKAAVVLSTCLCLLGFFGTLTERTTRSLVAGVATVALLVFAIRFRLFLRPYLFSYLCFAATLWLLGRYRSSGARSNLVAIAAVVLVWANLSKGVFFGPVLVGLACADQLVRRRFDRDLWITLAATALLSMANPDGPAVYGVVWRLVAGSPAQQGTAFLVGEHQQLSVGLLWGTGLRYTVFAQVLAFGAIVHFAALRGWRVAFHLLLFVVFLAPAITNVRLLSFFSMAASVGCFLLLHWALGKVAEAVERHRIAALTAASAVLVVLGARATTSDVYAFGNGPKPHTFPAAALDFLDQQQLAGRMFNSYSIGGFALWHSPHRPVFIDGRARMVYTPEFRARYFEILDSSEAWAKAEATYGFTIALLEYDLRDGARHFAKHLPDNPGWALVYWDRQSAVYVKRIPEHAQVIAQHEFRIARPARNDFSYIDRMMRGKPRVVVPGLLEQIDREIARSPDNQEPRLEKVYLAVVYGGQPFLAEGRAELERCLAMEPDLAMEHSAYGALLLGEGRVDEARAEIARALELDPRDANANRLRTKVGLPPPDMSQIPGH